MSLSITKYIFLFNHIACRSVKEIYSKITIIKIFTLFRQIYINISMSVNCYLLNVTCKLYSDTVSHLLIQSELIVIEIIEYFFQRRSINSFLGFYLCKHLYVIFCQHIFVTLHLSFLSGSLHFSNKIYV